MCGTKEPNQFLSMKRNFGNICTTVNMQGLGTTKVELSAFMMICSQTKTVDNSLDILT